MLRATGMPQGSGFFPNISTPLHRGTSPLECWYSGVLNQTAYLAGSAAWALGNMYASPLAIGRSGKLDRIAFETTANVPTSVARVGLYRATSNSNIYPAERLADGGEQDCNAGPGIKSTTISVDVTPGLYWLVMLAGVAAPTLRRIPGGGLTPIIGVPGALGAAPYSYLVVAQAYGAMPATYPAGGALNTVGIQLPPAIHVRFAS